MNSSFNNPNLASIQVISWDPWLPDTHMYKADKFLCCCCSVTKYCSTLCDTMGCSVLHFVQFVVLGTLLKFMSTESVMPSNHLIFIICCPCSFSLQSFPASGSFPVSWLFTSGSQSIGASASASVFPIFSNILG